MPICTTSVTAEALAEKFNLVYRGKPGRVIKGIRTLDVATEGDLSFFTVAKYMPQLRQTRAGVVLLTEEDASECPSDVFIVSHPRMAFAQVASWLFQPPEQSKQGIHPSAVVMDGAKVSPEAYVGPNVTIGDNVVVESGVCLMGNISVGFNSVIGAGTLIHPNVTLYSDTKLGKSCVVHSGTVIGADGFGFEPDEKGRWHKVPQIGGVTIGERVEIGSNCSIDRGAVEDTVIEDGVILDNLIQIAHNVRIGAHSAIAGCTGISGSTVIGRHCLVGGGTCIKGHITIADGVHISGMSMVTRSIRKPGVYSSGMPVKEKSLWLKNVTRFHQLDEIARRLKDLESKVIAD